ncbi:platelet-activating factor acetylhydrolase, isoform II-domain-containing protein [Coniella lustricola]|uniref:Putative phospholipase n=1 Tax=Coniella lustricola TaxID=2025994 RepID=A0A2T3AF06_9PEZI|nr:platelet-activating factor acetylhydrolase, isoform II-domain-containing protein [Coniella lustricola]
MAPAAAKADKAAYSEKMSYFLNKVNPIPTLPEYSGPYKVGTVDIEIPVADIEAPSQAPSNAADIHTVLCRVFYPAQPDSKGKKITWLPAPQRQHISAYTKFLGFGNAASDIISFLPRHVHYATIPVHKNASILEPETIPEKRWPTMIFSHGLGGNRNAYSHIAGSMASHGVVVFCPEHRDGSAAVSFVRDPTTQSSKSSSNSSKHMIPYIKISHDQTKETWDARDRQLKVRLWELGMLHETILDLDAGRDVHNLNASTPATGLSQFASKLNVRAPGSIIFGGHSFGAATVVQFLKSTYYADSAEVQRVNEPLFTPSLGSRIRAQITARNPLILLDMWCFPLLSPNTSALYRLPLPAYTDKDPSAPGGAAILAVESEHFFKWTDHLHAMCRIISPEPSAPVVQASAFERPGTGIKVPEPHFYYVVNSAHLNQSDFGALFPWLTKKIFGAEQPERSLRLNVRAMLQLLRTNNIPVARTWAGDLADNTELADKLKDAETTSVSSGEQAAVADDGLLDDKAIFDRANGETINHWKWIDIVGMGGKSGHSGDEGKPERVEGESDMESEVEGAAGAGATVVGATA